MKNKIHTEKSKDTTKRKWSRFYWVITFAKEYEHTRRTRGGKVQIYGYTGYSQTNTDTAPGGCDFYNLYKRMERGLLGVNNPKAKNYLNRASRIEFYRIMEHSKPEKDILFMYMNKNISGDWEYEVRENAQKLFQTHFSEQYKLKSKEYVGELAKNLIDVYLKKSDPRHKGVTPNKLNHWEDCLVLKKFENRSEMNDYLNRISKTPGLPPGRLKIHRIELIKYNGF